jgi:sugar phosphate isomerase/epimerase
MRDISYQLFSSRNFPPLGDTLQMLAELGYLGVEGYGPLFDSDAALDETRAALDASGLAMPTAHVGLDLLAQPAQVLTIAERLGLRAVFAPYLAPEERPTDAAGWQALGAQLAALGAPLWEAGLAFGWHNHEFEFQPLEDGQYPIDLLLGADERLVLEMDVAWVVRAGEDPHAWMTKFASRILALHVKDIAPAGEALDEDGWADVGHGTMDWPALLSAAEQTGAQHLIVEHDNPSDHARFAKRAMTSLQEA